MYETILLPKHAHVPVTFRIEISFIRTSATPSIQRIRMPHYVLHSTHIRPRLHDSNMDSAANAVSSRAVDHRHWVISVNMKSADLQSPQHTCLHMTTQQRVRAISYFHSVSPSSLSSALESVCCTSVTFLFLGGVRCLAGAFPFAVDSDGRSCCSLLRRSASMRTLTCSGRRTSRPSGIARCSGFGRRCCNFPPEKDILDRGFGHRTKLSTVLPYTCHAVTRKSVTHFYELKHLYHIRGRQ